MLGQLLVALDDRVGAWGVNQIDLAQPGYRDVDNAIVIASSLSGNPFDSTETFELSQRNISKGHNDSRFFTSTTQYAIPPVKLQEGRPFTWERIPIVAYLQA